ncbi:laminin subunit alpha-3-like [Centropristis striata]|uniref:laminin subunit alpha-3-like n=1 Tax=Centropristis striata TaxID=184440 RepID=UPI0027DF8BDD|nr:laminin subunit alpha-3-like [Centropristis striata]
MLEEIKTDFERQAAQLDGANLQLLEKLNNIFRTKVDAVTRAEQRAEELSRQAAELQQFHHNATGSTDLLNVPSKGVFYSIRNAVGKAERAANQSRKATDHALQGVKERGLVNRAEGLKDNSTSLQTDANVYLRELKVLSQAVNTLKYRVNKQKEKAESVRTSLSAVSDDLRDIKRDDTDILIKSAKTAASGSNSMAQNITERLRNISHDVQRITVNTVSENTDDVLTGAERALKNLKAALPVLKDRITHVEALSVRAPPSANMTESIRRIKDVIEEMRNFVRAPAGSQCEQRERRGELQLSEENSWLSYNLPTHDLNHRPHFSLDIKTETSKGLILHVAGRGLVPLLALYIANGKIKMSLGQNRIIQHKQRSNDGNWHRVEFSVEKSTFHLLVDGFRVTDGLLPNDEGSSLDLQNPVYLGADPASTTTKAHNIPTNSIIGCFRDFKMNDVAVGEPEETHRTSACLDWLRETGAFFGGGHVVLEKYFGPGSQFVLAFELRPRYLTGLLFHVQSHTASLSVFLVENKVGVTVNDGHGVVSVSVSPPESLCDGKFHKVTVSKQRDVIKLVLDSTSEQRATAFSSTSTSPETLYIGGAAEQSRAPVLSPFVGCLRNVKLNGRVVEFEAGSRLVGPVIVNRCPD